MSSHFVDVWTLRWHALHCSTYIIDTNEFADSGPLRLKTRAAPRERKLRQYRCNDAICWLNICRIKCLICSVASWWMTIYRKNSYHPVLKQWKTDLTSTSGPGTTQKLNHFSKVTLANAYHVWSTSVIALVSSTCSVLTDRTSDYIAPPALQSRVINIIWINCSRVHRFSNVRVCQRNNIFVTNVHLAGSEICVPCDIVGTRLWWLHG